MKNFRLALIALFALLSISAFAGSFGGSRASSSSSSFSSSSRTSSSSTFGGSRSGAATRTYSAPIVRSNTTTVSPSKPSAPALHSTTEVHHYHDSGNSFLHGMILGNALNNHPVVVAEGGYVPNGTVVVQESHPIAWAIVILFFSITFVMIVYFFIKSENEE